MKLTAVILTVTLLVGCSLPTKHKSDISDFPITNDALIQLQAALKYAPLKLNRVLIKEARNLQSENIVSHGLLKTEKHFDLQYILDIILNHSSNKYILPDEEFYKLNETIAGDEVPVKEAYARELTSFISHPELSCQHLIYSSYFQSRFHSSTIPLCNTEVPFVVFRRFVGSQVIWVDPKRVQSIHLLFASNSSRLASRFGHVALRLVVCPNGETDAVRCDMNLAEHIVLGFMAKIDDFTLNTFKALNGDYKAYLFASRFLDTYDDYAIGEFRDVFSVPLLINDSQRELMVRELSEIHWSYSGKYSFFSKNCSTILQTALNATWPDFALNDTFQDVYWRPDHFFEAVKLSSLADGKLLSNLDAAEHDGYYFPSTKKFYDLALNEVRASLRQPDFIDIESYLKIDPRIRRKNQYEDTIFFTQLKANQHLREALIILEEYAISRSGRLLVAEAAKYFEEQNFVSKKDFINQQLDPAHAKVFNDCLISQIEMLQKPLQRVTAIPNKSNLPVVAQSTSECRSTQNRKLLFESIADIKGAKSKQWKALNEISLYWSESIENVEYLERLN